MGAPPVAGEATRASGSGRKNRGKSARRFFRVPQQDKLKPPSPENPSRPLRVSQVLRSRVVITIVLIKADSLNRNLHCRRGDTERVISALRAAFGGCAPKRACGRRGQ